ncbi:ubiquinone biosynthesis accessory factor UbiJ [Pseudomonas sp. LRF_L74]|uniref:ubiquinone biosynthesis accessory factor UbiJ n=1 Tax=Pseudomonas sp. LRF_L74 TaxID=3369422 RepID=UPI003F60CB98
MFSQALLATAEHGLDRVLRMDSTALPRLARLQGKVIRIEASAFSLYLLPSAEGLRLASHWEHADCTLRAPNASLLRLALGKHKTAVLHEPEVELEGDSAALLDLAAILQDLELDWEFEVSQWLGPVASQLLSGHLRSRFNWTRDNLDSLRDNLADYLAEESRLLVGRREAEARFAELDRLKLALDRLDARVANLARKVNPSA